MNDCGYQVSIMNMEDEHLMILPWEMANEFFMTLLLDIESEEAMIEEKKDALIVFMAVAYGVVVGRIVCTCMYVSVYICVVLRWIF